MPHGITQCYLPPGRGDISAFENENENRLFGMAAMHAGFTDVEM